MKKGKEINILLISNSDEIFEYLKKIQVKIFKEKSLINYKKKPDNIDIIIIDSRHFEIEIQKEFIKYYNTKFIIPIILIGEELQRSIILDFFELGIQDYLIINNLDSLYTSIIYSIERKGKNNILKNKIVDYDNKLKNSKEKYKTLFSEANDAIFIMNNKCFLDCNKKTLEIFGCKNEEIIGHSPVEFSPKKQPDGKESKDKARHKIANAFNGKPQRFYWKHCKKDKTLFDTEVSLKSLKIQGETVLQAIVRDITSQKKLEDKLKKLSITDPLTKIYNRLKFEEVLEYEINRERRYGNSLSILMFDIDDFKDINDMYGHHVGDEVLIEVVGIVKKNIRNQDIFTRWGGDEFVILFPNTDLKRTEVLAERIREKVENFTYKQIDYLSISIGVTQFVINDNSNIISHRVDKALIEAKRNGKNQIVSIFG